MKILAFCFMLLCFTPACASNSPDTPVEGNTWIEIDPQGLNSQINRAYQLDLGWVKKPQLYVFELFYLDEIKQFSYKFAADNTESPQTIIISLMRDGFLDDSIRGDLQRIELAKNKKGEWNIRSLKKAHRCWRSEEKVFTTKPCP